MVTLERLNQLGFPCQFCRTDLIVETLSAIYPPSS